MDETKTEEAPQVVIPETEVPAESETESETGSEPVQPEEEGGRIPGLSWRLASWLRERLEPAIILRS